MKELIHKVGKFEIFVDTENYTASILNNGEEYMNFPNINFLFTGMTIHFFMPEEIYNKYGFVQVMSISHFKVEILFNPIRESVIIRNISPMLIKTENGICPFYFIKEIPKKYFPQSEDFYKTTKEQK